jgi:hypothetical protein
MSLADLQADIEATKARFNNKRKNLALLIRNENANATYTTDVIMRLFAEVRLRLRRAQQTTSANGS